MAEPQPSTQAHVLVLHVPCPLQLLWSEHADPPEAGAIRKNRAVDTERSTAGRRAIVGCGASVWARTLERWSNFQSVSRLIADLSFQLGFCCRQIVGKVPWRHFLSLHAVYCISQGSYRTTLYLGRGGPQDQDARVRRARWVCRYRSQKRPLHPIGRFFV